MKQSITFFLIIVLASCYTTSRVSNQNLSYLYWKESSILHPQYRVFHKSDSITVIYYHIWPKELLFIREDSKGEFTSHYQIHYNLYPSYESKELLDSASFNYNIVRPTSKSGIINSFEINTPNAGTFLLEMSIKDLKRRQTAKFYLNIDKSSINSQQTFMVYDQSEKIPVFRSYLYRKEQVTIQHNNPKIKKLRLNYYKSKLPIAAPPFSVIQQKPINAVPDSFADVNILEDGMTQLRFEKPGIYHLMSDTNGGEGIAFFRYNDGFPGVTMPEEMIGPLRYITTKREYSEMTLLDDKKLAVDNFWLNITGNPDRGRKIIKQYYNRVRAANIYFSSYLEGWKSDRGMVFIVYGPPDVVYRNSSAENWIYGEEGNIMSVNFTFYKTENFLSDNDYRLNRSAIYKNSWYLTVDAWRQGIIY